MATGKVVQIIGTVVDVEFPADELPSLFDALELDNVGEKRAPSCARRSAGGCAVRPRVSVASPHPVSSSASYSIPRRWSSAPGSPSETSPWSRSG